MDFNKNMIEDSPICGPSKQGVALQKRCMKISDYIQILVSTSELSFKDFLEHLIRLHTRVKYFFVSSLFTI